MRYRAIVILAASVLTACGNRGGALKGDDGGRLHYINEENRVTVMTLKRTAFPVQILSNGRLSAGRKAALSFHTTGNVSYLHGGNGTRVAKGEVIAKIDRPDFEIALESAEIALDKARLDYLDRLAGLGYSAKDTADIPADVKAMAKMRSGYTAAQNALTRARYDMDGVVLKAPFPGVLADISTKLYDSAPTGALCSLIDDSAMDVTFTVMESDYARISIGMDIRVIPFADASSEYRGKVTRINPVVGVNSLISVEGSIPGRSGLFDGMNVHVIVEKTLPDRLVVPKEAVVIRDNMNVLFTYSDDGVAHWVYVNILNANSESYSVEANSSRGAVLSEGDRVITSGNLNLADGSKVFLVD